MNRAPGPVETNAGSPTATASRIWKPQESRQPAASGADMLSVQFDRGVALLGYGLLVLSVFTAGLPALGAVALATAHSRDTNPIARSHYRHQIGIFWSGVVCLTLGAVAGVVAATFALSSIWDWMTAQIPWLETTIGRVVLPGDRVQVAGWLAMTAVLLFVFGAGHTLISSLWGAMKLVRGRPIGHIHVD